MNSASAGSLLPDAPVNDLRQHRSQTLIDSLGAGQQERQLSQQKAAGHGVTERIRQERPIDQQCGLVVLLRMNPRDASIDDECRHRNDNCAGTGKSGRAMGCRQRKRVLLREFSGKDIFLVLHIK